MSTMEYVQEYAHAKDEAPHCKQGRDSHSASPVRQRDSAYGPWLFMRLMMPSHCIRELRMSPYALEGTGAEAYLSIEKILAVALKAGCTAVHPGYGFLSESAVFSRRCAEEGLTFVGPNVEVLELFGDKAKARAFAVQCGVPVLPGTSGATSLAEAKAFFSSLGSNAAVMIKALAGGGGRGMRPVYSLADLDEAYERCVSEARASFGIGGVYVERLIRQPRHIEVQIVGDGIRVIHLGERECTLQRRNQKLIEAAPSPTLSPGLRKKITDAALQSRTGGPL